MVSSRSKHPNKSNQSAVDIVETLQAKHFERVRIQAEKGLRSLIHTEYRRRLGQKLSSLKGMPFQNPAARMREARRRIGIASDEVHGGELSAQAALTINAAADVDRFLSAIDDQAGGTIFYGLQLLEIRASDIARVIVEANASVKKSVRLLRAEEAAENEYAMSAQDPTAHKPDQFLKELLAKRSRRRTFPKL